MAVTYVTVRGGTLRLICYPIAASTARFEQNSVHTILVVLASLLKRISLGRPQGVSRCRRQMP